MVKTAVPLFNKAYCPKRFYRRRHKIELLPPHQRLAARCNRYDKLARSFLAATTLVAVLYWIKL